MNSKIDNIFAQPTSTEPFTFDKNVAEVFPDMIKRSVPGYGEIIQNISLMAKRFVTDNSQCYDLGCSLGAASLAMSEGISASNVKIIAVDNSKAMLERCQQHINAFKHNNKIELHQSNIQEINIDNASMIVLNFTLQFIANEERQNMLQNIWKYYCCRWLLLHPAR